jgi:hypothetical protein
LVYLYQLGLVARYPGTNNLQVDVITTPTLKCHCVCPKLAIFATTLLANLRSIVYTEDFLLASLVIGLRYFTEWGSNKGEKPALMPIFP